ncbi:hypothetical protein D3C72_196360 [compost metagenome]
MQFKRAPKKPSRQPANPHSPRKSSRHLWVGLAVIVAVLAGGGAWAYQTVTRQPEPVPEDDARIPPPSNEPLSRYFPSHTAVYGRLSLNGPTSALVRHGLSGFGLGAIFEGMPWTRYILPGLNAMMGYPLLLDGNGELALENQAALESDETRKILAEIFAQAEGDAVLGIYATEHGAMPFQATMGVRLSNPARARAKLAELRQSFNGAPLFDGIRLDGSHLWVSTSPQTETMAWSDLQRDDAFKRTMAHLPRDRFATMYVNGVELRRISEAYERYLQGGEEVGAALLGLAGGLIADPSTQALLSQLDREGFDKQHLGTAATFRLGILQGHTHTDWQPEDPESLKQASESLLRASTLQTRFLAEP